MQIIDTHAHIYLPEFDADREEMKNRALAAGVGTILLPAIDAGTHGLMLALAAQWEACLPMMGLHPCSVTGSYQDELATVETYLNEQKFIAIGEIGLDFYWDTTFKKEQYKAFETQIEWALQYDLPIAIHSRNALDECIEVVQQYPGLRGVFHCFSGTVAQADRVRELAFHLGIGGVVTFKNAGFDKVLAAIGLAAVVLETDAPYLAPAPHRGKRNECGYLPLVIEKIAALTGLSPNEVSAITTQNAKTLFNLS